MTWLKDMIIVSVMIAKMCGTFHPKLTTGRSLRKKAMPINLKRQAWPSQAVTDLVHSTGDLQISLVESLHGHRETTVAHILADAYWVSKHQQQPSPGAYPVCPGVACFGNYVYQMAAN